MKEQLRELLESYNLPVLRRYLQVVLPQTGEEGNPKVYREIWRLRHTARKGKTVDAIMSVVRSPYEKVELELSDILERLLLYELKSTAPRKGQGLTEARRRAHNKYHKEVVSPRKKATRHFMTANPKLVEEIRRKHGLAQ